MKKIKFRFWDVNERIMFKVDSLELLYNTVVVKQKVTVSCGGDAVSFDGESHHVYDEDLLMQYTGRQDKNGKEIYDWDIFKILDDNIFWIVKFGTYSDDEQYSTMFHTGWYIERIVSQDHELEVIDTESINNAIENGHVIGNIYENPELLEDKK